MTDVDIIKSEPMDLNDDDTVESLQNGETKDAMKEETSKGKVVQVTNVSPGATLQQLATLFGFLGTVTDIRLYPSDETVPVQVKVCFINYENNEQCGVAQHLTNTVFIDKALIVVPINREEIPEESECQHLIKSINAYATMASTGYLPSGFPPDEPGCSIPGIPPPPVIISTTDPVEIEEIKRTIFVQNIDEKVTSEQLMAFFSGVGEIKYMRLCKTEITKYAFIEFSGCESVPTALQYNGVIFGGRCLKVEHAKSPIVKPESEHIASGRNHLRTGRDAVKRPSSVNWGIKVINAHIGDQASANDASRRSRSRSRSRRSRSRGRKSKSRSKARSRSGSRSRRRKSRSKSPIRRRSSPAARSPKRRSKSRSRSKTKRRSRSRSRSPVRRRRRSVSRSRSRSRSWSKRRRSRSRSHSRDRRRKGRSLSKSASRSPRRPKKKSKSRSRSPRRRKSKRSSSKSPDRRKSKGKDKDEKKERNKDNKEKDKSKEKDKAKDKENELSPEKDLKSLLDKVYTYEEEKGKEKERKKSSKEKELCAES